MTTYTKPHRIQANGTIIFTVTLALRPGRDDDLIEALASTSKGQLAGRVREMMRNGNMTAKFISGDNAENELELDLGIASVDL